MPPTIQKKVTGFFNRYKELELAKGQLIIRAGQEPSGIFFLQQGQIRQYDITGSGDEIVICVFKAPAFLPMSWAINQTSNQYFYEAFTPIKFRKAPVEEVLSFLRSNPDVMLDLLSRVYKGIDSIQKRMVFMMQNSARRRIAFELIYSHERFGEKQKDGTINIQLRESELAARIGLTRETVNREIRSFKKLGLVNVSASGITINDISMLKKELHPDQ